MVSHQGGGNNMVFFKVYHRKKEWARPELTGSYLEMRQLDPVFSLS